MLAGTLKAEETSSRLKICGIDGRKESHFLSDTNGRAVNVVVGLKHNLRKRQSYAGFAEREVGGCDDG